MTMTMMRAGRYTVTDAGRLAGRITGDFVIGFRAERADGSILPDRYPDPNSAAKALKTGPAPRHVLAAPSSLAARLTARSA